MAEAIAGSEEEFAREMTEKAQRDRPHQQHLRQCHRSRRARAPDDRARPGRCWRAGSSPTSPNTSNTTREREFEYAGIKQPNRNPLLQAGVPGVDGMKTGFTDECRLRPRRHRQARRPAHHRGAGRARFRRAAQAARASGCWSTAFASSRNTGCSSPGQTVAEADVWLGVAPKVPLRDRRTVVAITLSREARKGLVVKLDYDSPVPAPVAAGPGAGPGRDHRARAWRRSTVPLVAGSDVPGPACWAGPPVRLSYLIWGAPAS